MLPSSLKPANVEAGASRQRGAEELDGEDEPGIEGQTGEFSLNLPVLQGGLQLEHPKLDQCISVPRQRGGVDEGSVGLHHNTIFYQSIKDSFVCHGGGVKVKEPRDAQQY